MMEATRWCPRCGAEYREEAASCSDCDVALTEVQPEQQEEDREVVVYELDDWSAEQRGALEMRLQAEAVEHQWETPTGADVEAGYEPGRPWEVATELVVGEKDEESVDAILDDIEHPDALEGVAEGEDDEATYAVMSQLYVAADRLKDDPDDLALAGEFFEAADAAGNIEPPFGIEAEVWRRVQELAREVAASMEQEDDDEVVAGHARRLRDVLFSYV